MVEKAYQRSEEKECNSCLSFFSSKIIVLERGATRGASSLLCLCTDIIMIMVCNRGARNRCQLLLSILS